MSGFSSAAYWERRYQGGGTSGAGSYGRLARFKADFINNFVRRHAIASVLDLGCGDGNLLSLLQVPDYTGIDVSPTSLAGCAARFPAHRFLSFDAIETVPAAELALSIDVVFHLIEDAVFVQYMHALFAHATRFVLVYASNVDHPWPSPHVRHRRFSDHVTATQPDWRLQAHVPNRYPFDPASPDDTSFADFFVYARLGDAAASTPE
ncbi:MAG: class I SAM-dependent methyltransferase [Acetobacteraceae bacterium]|nr:class I SAM-dependent methyltransferase [Acetobacteraceae bacterium]